MQSSSTICSSKETLIGENILTRHMLDMCYCHLNTDHLKYQVHLLEWDNYQWTSIIMKKITHIQDHGH